MFVLHFPPLNSTYKTKSTNPIYYHDLFIKYYTISLVPLAKRVKARKYFQSRRNSMSSTIHYVFIVHVGAARRDPLGIQTSGAGLDESISD